LNNLRELDLGNNRIENIADSFSLLPALETLFVDNNQIQRLARSTFANNTQLVELDLHSNRIRVIEEGTFDQLLSLTTLRLDGNLCVNEDFEIEAGDIASILPALSQCIPRSEIVLECDFENDDRGYVCILENVDVEEDIPIVIRGEHLEGRSNEDVEWVHFTDSKLEFIPQELFDTFPSLSTLDVTDNELPRLNVLRNCENLENLFASFNNIEVVEANVFRECSNLRILHLTRNNINEFHSNGLTNLVELTLNSNNISEIDTETFGYLENLEILYLNDNRIRYTYPIMLVALSNLRILYLSFNKITELFPEEFNPLVNLEELSLYGNRIQTVSPLAFRNLNNLRVLDLGNNRIENITDSFSLLPALETLFVDNNLIQRLARSTFANNTQLVELDLHGNRIREIEEGTFDQLLSLTTLRLDGNLCVNEDFEIEAGDIASILPALRRCNPLRDMVCRFDPMVRGYDCRIDNQPPFFVRSIRFE
jgi:Leucine-rich repeat (LRR) protein